MKAKNKKIPLVNVKRQVEFLKKDFMRAIRNVLDKSDFIMGEDLKQFETEFARFMGVPYAIGVDNGTSAIELVLRALGIGEGDEVIVPVFTFIATATAVSYTGAKPVFVDIRPDTFTIDVDKLKSAINKKTKAIIPVHLYGNAVKNIAEIMNIARARGIAVIEDTCQAHGLIIGGKRAGTIGDAGAFSFFPSKNLGGMGDGGMVITKRPDIADKVKKLRNCGRTNHYFHEIIGFNKRLDTLQAAILRIKLRCLDDWNKKRIKAAAIYNKLLSSLPINLPDVNGSSVFHLYVIKTERRNELKEFLVNRGIDAGIHYPVPIHLQEAFKSAGYRRGDFQTAEQLSGKVLSLPVCPFIKEPEINYVANCVKEFFY